MSLPDQFALIERIAALLEQPDPEMLRDALIALLSFPCAARGLRALDGAGLLTRMIPELEAARVTEQPGAHFLPVLAHSIEAVAAVDWLLAQIALAAGAEAPSAAAEGQCAPAAVEARPELRYRSAYAAELQARFTAELDGYPQAALFRLAALLHDVGKPQTKQDKPGGGVSFHEHQTVGGEIALAVALRLGFSDAAAGYVRLVVREHMRPGQLAILDPVTRRAVQRFFFVTGDAGPDVLLHMLADHMATRGPAIQPEAWAIHAAWIDALLETIWGATAELARPLVDGNDLMRALGVAPGPLLGRLLAAIGEAQAGGDITTADEAIELARRLLRLGRSGAGG